MKATTITYCLLLLCLFLSYCQQKEKEDTAPRRIEILFLGHDSEHHNSAEYMPMLASALFKKGINLTYTEQPDDLNPEKLDKYDGLIIYANHDSIKPAQEKALLNFVAEGKGFIPVHSASFCFQNSPAYIDLVGAQFQKHATGDFMADIVKPDHPAMEGVQEFTTWDETYIHQKHNSDRTILMERQEGDHREPWTWVREYGKGKVFYTAYGHDERTWNHTGFHQLMEEGILWAVGDNVKSQWEAYMADMPALSYKEAANIPNYEKRDPAPKLQAPLSPEESKKLIQVPADFELELFASEPDIINPIAMDWDEKGRLWVIETVDYPNTVRNDKGRGDDRIKICEDTDGDGKADKFTVFAENLNIPTSMVFAKGGIIISQAPHFLFLKDTDGDDKADVKEVLMDGWGTFDTHAGPSNLKYGMDNWIWGVVGYSGFKGTIANKNHQFSQGAYRFKPGSGKSDISAFEFLTNTSNNTWGLGFTETNDVFASTANNTHSVYMGIPNQFYEGVDGLHSGGSIKIDGHYAMHPVTENVRQVDVFGGFTAASGHNFYTARNYPSAYWNRVALVCEPTGHLLHMAAIEKEGAGFVEKDGWNLLSSADEWVSPVEAKVGPDGAVWVLDWYNFIVQHNPTPTPERGGFEGENGEGNAHINPLRDREHGRIWRVVYKNAKPYEPVTLSKDDPEELIATLKNDNMFWRTTAQRLLVERGETDVLPELYKLVNKKSADKMGLNNAAVHALWTIHGLGALDGSNEEAYRVATKALYHPAAGVRKAAVQVLPKTQWANQAILRSNMINDPDPHTRMAAVLAIGDMKPSKGAGKRLYEISLEEEIKNDHWLSKAVYVAAARHSDGFMAAFLEDNPKFEEMRARRNAMPTREDVEFDDSNWQTMKLPEFFERADLDIDGIVWFRKVVDIPAEYAKQKGSIHLGPIDETDETWINGVRVGGVKDDYRKERVYDIPAKVLKPGKNLISVKVEDYRGWGGFSGKPEQMFMQAGNFKKSLAGAWKYEVEKEFKSGAQPVFEDAPIAEVFMDAYWNKAGQPSGVAADASGSASATVVNIKTIKNEMKFDLEEIVVEAGKTVRIIFENPDFMQHNLLVIQPGSLETVGAAADKLATDPQGAEKQYVPDMPEVLYNTKLVNPEETVELTFTAPEEPGAYPFVCTFPGHWRIMQGTMKVVSSENI